MSDLKNNFVLGRTLTGFNLPLEIRSLIFCLEQPNNTLASVVSIISVLTNTAKSSLELKTYLLITTPSFVARSLPR